MPDVLPDDATARNVCTCQLATLNRKLTPVDYKILMKAWELNAAGTPDDEYDRQVGAALDAAYHNSASSDMAFDHISQLQHDSLALCLQ